MISDVNESNVYYNPKFDHMAIGPFFLSKTSQMVLVVYENEYGFTCLDITDMWLEGWEYLGPLC